MTKAKKAYHHGDLAQSLLDAVDQIATQFGLEAVSLRACAKLLGVSPSSAFRHYVDKRALLTAFATRALDQLSAALAAARADALKTKDDDFVAVCLAYIEFAIDKPAFFRAMWREETIYPNDDDYVRAQNQLSAHLKGGFAGAIADEDPDQLSPHELLVWSSVHGLACLLVDGPIDKGREKSARLETARAMILSLRPAVIG